MEEGEDVAVGARVQFQPRHADTWMPGVVVGHGRLSPGKSQGRPCDIIDDHGVLWDKIPAAQVHATSATSHGADRPQSSAERRPRDAPMELLSPAGRTELSARREGLFAELMRLRDRLRFRREDEDEPEVPEEQAEQAEPAEEEDEEEDEDDEEESEQPPAGAGAAMAAFSAIGSPSDSGSASPPSFGFAGLSHAVAALSGPRSPSPPFVGRGDEDLRMLERFRSLEHILPEEILSGPVAGIQLRRGTGNDGVLEIRRIFEGNEGRTRGRHWAQRCHAFY